MGEHLRERFKRPGPKRILALDGGGSRGLLSLGVLEKLERHLGIRSGNPNAFRLADYFDLIGGTSTGAIIATTLALGWRARDIRELYFALLPAIFDKPQVPGPLRVLIPAFKNNALTKALKEHLGDRTLNSADLRTGLAIHAKRIDSGSAWVLVNNPDWCYFNAKADSVGIPNAQFYLRDLVQASAAAPTYFNDVRIDLARKGNRVTGHGHFFDGGVSPNNNPAHAIAAYRHRAGVWIQLAAGRKQPADLVGRHGLRAQALPEARQEPPLQRKDDREFPPHVVLEQGVGGARGLQSRYQPAADHDSCKRSLGRASPGMSIPKCECRPRRRSSLARRCSPISAWMRGWRSTNRSFAARSTSNRCCARK